MMKQLLTNDFVTVSIICCWQKEA